MDDNTFDPTNGPVPAEDKPKIANPSENDPILDSDQPATGVDYDLDVERAKMGLKPQDPEHPEELNSEAELEAADSNNNR